MENNRGEVVFAVEKRRRGLAILFFAVPLIIGAIIAGWRDGWGSALLGFAVGVVGVVVFVLTLKPVGHPVVKLTGEGVLVYEPGRNSPRLLPWSMISNVDFRYTKHAETHFGANRQSALLIFRLMALEWGVVLPAGAPPAEEIVAAIRAHIRPEVAAKTDSFDATAFFETIFHIRLPETARVLRSDWHPVDKSGLWSVRIAKEDFLKLRTAAGGVSEWWPLTRDQRFLVGGHRLVGTSDLNGEYAISNLDWDSTPVIVWDGATETLHGLLTRSVM